jgi:aspartokinase/homoserine dehydrogenase 1
MASKRLKINVVGVASSQYMLTDSDGLNLETCLSDLRTKGLPSSPTRLSDEIVGMNIFNSVVVDCTANAEIAALYRIFLEHNISVVAANKIAASSDYGNYAQLKELARVNGVKFLFETNVGAGLPIINTINSLINSGDVIERIQAVLSGTLNYIFNTISEDVSLSSAIRMAKAAGFSEPDPRVDLSGKDVIRKLVILAREAGYKVEQSDVVAHLFIPEEILQGTEDEFWQKLPQLDAEFEQRRKELAAKNACWRFVATMEHGKCVVALEEIDASHPFADLQGSNNIILMNTERYKEYPMIIKGYGAGASVTAAGVFADIISIANVR